MTSSWFFLSTLNYDARSTTHLTFFCLITVKGARYWGNYKVKLKVRVRVKMKVKVRGKVKVRKVKGKGKREGEGDFESKIKQSHCRLEWSRGFQQVKVPRFHDNGPGW